MPRPASERSRSWSQGYERGSVASQMSNEQRKAWRKWMKERSADSNALEGQLSNRRTRATNPYAEV